METVLPIAQSNPERLQRGSNWPSARFSFQIPLRDMEKAAPQASSPADLRRLLEALTGQEAQLDVELPALAVQVLVSSSGLGYSQLNELLLLLGFDRVSYALTCRVSSDQSLLENGPFGVS